MPFLRRRLLPASIVVVLLAGSAGPSCALRKLGVFCSPTSVSYALKFRDDKSGGWGCAHAFTKQSTESGFHTEMYVGSGTAGRLLVYGHGDFQPKPRRDIHLALFQRPGKPDVWYCAAQGSMEADGKLRRLKMTQIQSFTFPESTAGGDKLDVKNENFEIVVNGATDKTRNFLGHGCDADQTHCSFDVGSELSPYRVYVRTNERADHPVPVAEALIIREEGRSPGRLSISHIRPAAGSRSSFSAAGKPELHLDNIPPFLSCPGSGMESGELTAEWDEKP